MNNFTGVGRITTDLKLQTTQESEYCKFTLAIDNPINKTTDFINCICWNKIAQNLCQHQSKGNLIAISGSLHTYSWATATGEKKYSYDIEISKLMYLEKKRQESDKSFDNDSIKLDTPSEEEIDPFLEYQKQIDNEVEIDDSFLD